MTLIGNVFPILWNPKNVVRCLSQKRRWRVPFKTLHGKRAETRLKSVWWNLYQIYWSLTTQLSLKKSLLMTWKVLKLFVNTFIADDKYSLINRDNLTQPIQNQLTQTPFKSKRRHLYHIYQSLRRILRLKKFLLVIWKIVRLFVNRFTADNKYSLLKRDNLMQPIQTQLPHRKKTFCSIFFYIFEI